MRWKNLSILLTFSYEVYNSIPFISLSFLSIRFAKLAVALDISKVDTLLKSKQLFLCPYELYREPFILWAKSPFWLSGFSPIVITLPGFKRLEDKIKVENIEPFLCFNLMH